MIRIAAIEDKKDVGNLLLENAFHHEFDENHINRS